MYGLYSIQNINNNKKVELISAIITMNEIKQSKRFKENFKKRGKIEPPSNGDIQKIITFYYSY